MCTEYISIFDDMFSRFINDVTPNSGLSLNTGNSARKIHKIKQIAFTYAYLHLTSSRASTATDRAEYDSWSARHFRIAPWRSLLAGICTTDAADHVLGLSGSVEFVCGCRGDISWSPARENLIRGRK